MGKHQQQGSPAPRCLPVTALGRTLVEAVARAIAGRDCGDLTAPFGWSAADPDGAAGFPLGELQHVDPAEVADWVVRQYGDGPFPAVVVGSPHGSAAHLAVSMNAPWLPAGFEVEVAWPDGSLDDADGVLRRGEEVGLLLDRWGVAARHVFDPLRYGFRASRQTTHHCSWRELPAPYRAFLDRCLEAGATIILISDLRQWRLSWWTGGGLFQVGSPTTGMSVERYLAALARAYPAATAALGDRIFEENQDQTEAEHRVHPGFVLDLRRLVGDRNRQLYSIAYREPEQLSAALADVTREWLRHAGTAANHLVVDCGRLLDPYHVGRAGLVPYWCESSSTTAVESAELWLAGSIPFEGIEALPEPGRATHASAAVLGRWQTLVSFARRNGTIDRNLARAYAGGRASPRDATSVLRQHQPELPAAPRLQAQDLDILLRELAMNGPHAPAPVELDLTP
jgi:hypothetical protein